jgi:hypothetical protein
MDNACPLASQEVFGGGCFRSECTPNRVYIVLAWFACARFLN